LTIHIKQVIKKKWIGQQFCGFGEAIINFLILIAKLDTSRVQSLAKTHFYPEPLTEYVVMTKLTVFYIRIHHSTGIRESVFYFFYGAIFLRELAS
jgi:hypothetical protein